MAFREGVYLVLVRGDYQEPITRGWRPVYKSDGSCSQVSVYVLMVSHLCYEDLSGSISFNISSECMLDIERRIVRRTGNGLIG